MPGESALLWLSFGLVHSLLARNSSKLVLQPLFGRTYRISYNLFSALHIGLVIIGGEIVLGGNSVGFDLGRDLAVAAKVCQLAGIVVIVASLTQYDLGRFSGITQLFQGDDQAVDEELPP